MIGGVVQAQDTTYQVQYIWVDSVAQQALPSLTTSFPNQAVATAYIMGLPRELQGKGYITASVDDYNVMIVSRHVYISF